MSNSVGVAAASPGLYTGLTLVFLCESGAVSVASESKFQNVSSHAQQGSQVIDRKEDTTQVSVVPQEPTINTLECALYQFLWCIFSQHGN